MPKKINNWDEIRDTFVSSEDLTYSELAKMFGVSRQSIESRASVKAENWQALREAFRKNLPSPPQIALAQEDPLPVVPIDQPLKDTDIDKLVDCAIVRLYGQIQDAELRSLERGVDSFVRLVELRTRLKPPTVREWAEYARDKFKMNARELIQAVKQELG